MGVQTHSGQWYQYIQGKECKFILCEVVNFLHYWKAGTVPFSGIRMEGMPVEGLA